ncbi:MAG: hypothetical protein KDK36_19365, partial [Leptospiraceae bacterium]|nr:hypothetical protein [Leptospiraceae bacterium]
SIGRFLLNRRPSTSLRVTTNLISSVFIPLASLLLFTSSLTAAPVNGTIKTWAANDKLSAADLNQAITSLKTGITDIPNWTKSGSNAYFTDGNVGIKTTNPATTLELNGALSFRDISGRSYNSGIRSNGGSVVLALGINDGASNNFGSGYTSSEQGGFLQFDVRSGQPLLSLFGRSAGVTGNPSQNFSVTSSGHVGIGTPSPKSQLQISDGPTYMTFTANNNGTFTKINMGGINSANSKTIFTATANSINGSTDWMGISAHPASYGFLIGSADGTGSENSAPTVTPWMTIKSDGKVGIGTTSPRGLLDVSSSGDSTMLISGGASNVSELYFGTSVTPINSAVGFIQVNHTNENMYIGTSGFTRMTITGTGAVSIAGSLSKGSGTFDIPHPDPSMPKDARLRHSFVESPTAGDNIYRWKIKVKNENKKYYIKLPKYWSHLNENPMVWVSSSEKPAASYGYVDIEKNKIIIQADSKGEFNVLLIGTRKDTLAANNWKQLGLEYIAKGIGEAEKILTLNQSHEMGEEPEPINNKLSNIENLNQENQILKDELAKLKKDYEIQESKISVLEKQNKAIQLSFEARLKRLEGMNYARK